VRGPEADEDAAFCQKLAADFRLPFFLDRLPPPPPGVSKEAWWRQQRYRKLQARQQEFAAAAVATGHTLDDQAETVLLKLLRGAGPRGVAGIRRRWDFVIRPLLDFRRHQLREYLRQLGQPFREDSSNWVADRPRTFLRLRVMPLLEEAFPKACQHLAAFAQELLQDEELLAAWVEEKVPPLRLGEKLPVDLLLALPASLRWRWLQGLAASLPLPEPPSRQQFALFSQLLATGQPRGLDLGARWVLLRQGKELKLQPPPVPPFPEKPLRLPALVRLPGGFVLGLGQPVGRADHRAFLSPRVSSLPLAVKSLPPGLRFAGRDVRKELARHGIPSPWRAAWPGLWAGGTIVWVPGVGVLPGWAQASGVLAELEEPWERHGKLSPPRP
jgi:tRNA(Ile)-lysidine synthase